MSGIKDHIANNPRYGKALQWGKLVSVTGTAQVLVQLASFISGILVIRLLPVEEYAFYTIANTMLGAMSILSDGGVSAGVMARGGRIWRDKGKLGAVVATGLALRRKFALASLAVCIPILCYLLSKHDASAVTIVMTALSLVPAFYANLSDSLLQIAPKLHQAIVPLQKNQVGVGAGRLLLTALTLFVFPWASVAILASGIPRIWGNIRLKKISSDFADPAALPDRQNRMEIMKMVKRMMPAAIYYCVSGQITVWLISIFGSTSSVAQLGALTRIVALFAVLETMMSTLVVPRFARLKGDRKPAVYFIYILLLLVAMSLVVTGGTWIFSGPILWVLGPSYEGLDLALGLKVVGSCIGFISRVIYSLATSRGWAINPLLSIPVNLAAIVAGIFLFDVTSLQGILVFSIFTLSVEMVMNGIYCFMKTKLYSLQ